MLLFLQQYAFINLDLMSMITLVSHETNSHDKQFIKFNYFFITLNEHINEININ